MIESDEVITLRFIYGEFLGTLLGDANVKTLGYNVVTELDSLDGYFDGSSDGNLDGLLHEESLVSTDA